MTTAQDRYLDLYPDHLCVSCSPPVHLTCFVTRERLTAAAKLFVIGEERFAGFSAEAFHEAPWHPDCQATATAITATSGYWYRYHWCWWSVPLELLEDE